LIHAVAAFFPRLAFGLDGDAVFFFGDDAAAFFVGFLAAAGLAVLAFFFAGSPSVVDLAAGAARFLVAAFFLAGAAAVVEEEVVAEVAFFAFFFAGPGAKDLDAARFLVAVVVVVVAGVSFFGAALFGLPEDALAGDPPPAAFLDPFFPLVAGDLGAAVVVVVSAPDVVGAAVSVAVAVVEAAVGSSLLFFLLPFVGDFFDGLEAAAPFLLFFALDGPDLDESAPESIYIISISRIVSS